MLSFKEYVQTLNEAKSLNIIEIMTVADYKKITPETGFYADLAIVCVENPQPLKMNGPMVFPGAGFYEVSNEGEFTTNHSLKMITSTNKGSFDKIMAYWQKVGQTAILVSETLPKANAIAKYLKERFGAVVDIKGSVDAKVLKNLHELE